MDFSRALLIVALALVLVVVINVGLYLMVTRKNTFREIDLFRTAAGRARRPWQGEEEALDELSERVKQLKQQAQADQPPAEEQRHE